MPTGQSVATERLQSPATTAARFRNLAHLRIADSLIGEGVALGAPDAVGRDEMESDALFEAIGFPACLVLVTSTPDSVHADRRHAMVAVTRWSAPRVMMPLDGH